MGFAKPEQCYFLRAAVYALGLRDSPHGVRGLAPSRVFSAQWGYFAGMRPIFVLRRLGYDRHRIIGDAPIK